ncbi:MAG TPA: nuclear transport factor 2 family protein [Polyangiaceae bacterium]|nr:nuclear transport factor 2 family protein [Polyangiaceae bacterium]
MRTTAACPSDFALERFLLGESPRGAFDVADHIGGCDDCREKVAAKRADDAVFLHSPGAADVRRRLSFPERSDRARRDRPLLVRRSGFAAIAVVAAIAAGFALWRAPSAPRSTVGAEDDEQVVLRVQREWMEAIRDKDVAALDRILADDYTFTDSRGRVSHKEDSLRQARATGSRMKAFHTSERKAQIHGDVAVITGRVRTEGETGGTPYDAEAQFTDVLARIDGQWRAIAAHASSLSAK